MTIKTYDGAKLIQARLENTLSKYPSGSLSSREVLITIPSDTIDNELASKINSAITYAIYKSAENFLKNQPQTKISNKMTPLSDIKIKIDDTAMRNFELSNAVLDSIKTFSTCKN